jgi:O-methyltransferase involved in polyketide biosynthesis
MSSEAPSGVGKTALGMAMIRAQESRRSDRLFDDPYAAAFLAAALGVFDAEQRAAATGGATVCRRVHHGHVGVTTQARRSG